VETGKALLESLDTVNAFPLRGAGGDCRPPDAWEDGLDSRSMLGASWLVTAVLRVTGMSSAMLAASWRILRSP
jgi:hypothetical protein